MCSRHRQMHVNFIIIKIQFKKTRSLQVKKYFLRLRGIPLSRANRLSFPLTLQL